VAEEDRLHRGSDDFKIGRFLATLTICPLFATSATRLLWIRDIGLIEIRSSRPADVTELDIITIPRHQDRATGGGPGPGLSTMSTLPRSTSSSGMRFQTRSGFDSRLSSRS